MISGSTASTARPNETELTTIGLPKATSNDRFSETPEPYRTGPYETQNRRSYAGSQRPTVSHEALIVP